MPLTSPILEEKSLTHYVEEFEQAHERGDVPDLARHLPAHDDPRHGQVLRELIRIDIEHGWRRGQPKRLQDYQLEFATLFADSTAVADIAFEEYRQRRLAGEKATPAEYRARWGIDVSKWPTSNEDSNQRSLQTVATGVQAANADDSLAQTARAFRGVVAAEPASVAGWCERWSGDQAHASLFRDMHKDNPVEAERYADAVVTMPSAGSQFRGFHLVEELGRGAFGRVFLARQGELANRLVALKISADAIDESQTLAQLQHTNIVPIYSLHPGDPLHGVCMPFLGRTTLAHLLKTFRDAPSLPASGQELVSALQESQSTVRAQDDVPTVCDATKAAAGSTGTAPQGQAQLTSTVLLEKLGRLSYVEAVVWIGARLADGLAHAHERGVLHRDLKPANVLLTEEGQPMLLDFNLAEAARQTGGATRALVGGTLPYMAPEQLMAFHQGAKCNLDARADLYSLGIVLFELLTGQHPFLLPNGGMPSMFAWLLESQGRRPPAVRALNPAVSPAVETIIQRCLEPQPNRRYPSARALQEDFERHLDNLPLKHVREPSLRERLAKWRRRHPRMTSGTTIAACAAVLLICLAVALVGRGRHLARLEAGKALLDFQAEARKAQFFLTRIAERDRREKGLKLGREALDRYQVLSNPSWRQLPLVSYLPAADRHVLEEGVGEMLLMLATATAASAPSATSGETDLLNEALEYNRAAEGCYEVGRKPRALLSQRADLQARLKLEQEAETTRQLASGQPLRTARDYFLEGKELFEQGRHREALPFFRTATELNPQDYWAWSLRGRCHDEFQDNSGAVACYDTCIALEPTSSWGYFNRGLAYLRQQDHRRAEADFSRSIEFGLDEASAYFNRALARNNLNKNADAIADLGRVLELDPTCTRVYFVRSRIRAKVGDAAGAKQDWEAGLRQEPGDDLGFNARGFARLETDPKRAMADFDAALHLNPRSLPALDNKAYLLAEKMKQTDDAIRVLDQSIRFHPEYVPARASRGVLLARLGKYDDALRDAEESLLRNTDPPNLYQVAGIYALASTKDTEHVLKALQLLSSALRQGYGLDLVDEDHELDPIRARPEFKRLVEAAKNLKNAGS